LDVAELSQPPGQPTSPRLTIRQVMLWTAITAASMGLVRLFDRQQGDSLNFIHIYSVGLAILWGPALAALVSWPFWRRRGYMFPVHGGDWLLLVVGIGAALVIVRALTLAYFDWLMGGDSRGTFSTLNIHLLIDAATATIVLVAYGAATICVKSTPWRIALGLLAAAQFVAAAAHAQYAVNAFTSDDPFGVSHEGWLLMLTRIVYSFRGLGLTAPVILVSTSDLIRRRPLPWTHWLGVGVWLAARALHLLQYVWLTQRP
jgi:hypothetical protein